MPTLHSVAFVDGVGRYICSGHEPIPVLTKSSLYTAGSIEARFNPKQVMRPKAS
jgi:hypothetical protein